MPTGLFKELMMCFAITLSIDGFAAHAEGNSDSAVCAWQAEGKQLFYVVRKQDQLGFILKMLHLRPLWGEAQWARKTTEMNPELVKSQGDLIFPGMKIYLAVKNLERSRDYVVLPSGEVRVFNDDFSIDPYLGCLDEKAEKGSPQNINEAIETPETIEDLETNATSETSKTPEISKTPEHRFEFTVLPRYFGTRIYSKDRATGAHTTVYPILNYGVSLSGKMFLNSKWGLSLIWDIEHQTDSGWGRIQLHSLWTNTVSAKATYHFSENMKLNSSIQVAEKIFIRFTSATSGVTDSAYVVQFSQGGFYDDLLIIAGLKLSLGLGLKLSLPTRLPTTTSKMGFGPYMDGRLVIGIVRLAGVLSYDFEDTNASIQRSIKGTVGVEFVW